MSIRTPQSNTRNEPRLTKESAMERYMDAVLDLQKQQAVFTYRVGYAVATKQPLDFEWMRRDFDLVQEKIKEADQLKSAWEGIR